MSTNQLDKKSQAWSALFSEPVDALVQRAGLALQRADRQCVLALPAVRPHRGGGDRGGFRREGGGGDRPRPPRPPRND